MEQEAIIDVGEFDRRAVDLSKPAATVEEYIKQVIVSRERCEDVAVAKDLDRSRFKPAACGIPADESIRASCSFTPPLEWSQLKVDNFAIMRTAFEEQRDAMAIKKPLIKLPPLNDTTAWIRFCLETRAPTIPIAEKAVHSFEHHQGTPPTLPLILSFNDSTVNFVVIHLINHFAEAGYSRPLAEWIFSLLLAVRKPLLHDVCSSFRQMARTCRLARAKLDESQTELIREYTFFIAVISLHFGQKDLADC
ncbi:putative Survival of motor neuron protein-interacting protein 1 [Aphelenchoides fujianensis]|nr:putative Survival of motor neuron protein-interacting protein 1 [Aphelenchoides fujianensis]